MSAQLRPCQREDLPAVLAIYAEEVRSGVASWEHEPPDLEEMTRRFDAVTGEGYPFLVAVIDGQVAGYAYAGPYNRRHAYRWTVESSVYVSPSAQGRGLGRQLMEELIAICTARGHRQMLAIIGGAGNPGSVALHKALGFEHHATLPSLGWKFGRWHDLYIMQRKLGEGSDTAPEEVQ